SPYYLIAGFALLFTAALACRGSAWIYWCQAILVLATLGWALLEVGLDWWQLMPRGDLVVPLGLILAVPWVARRVQASGGSGVSKSGYVALACSLVICFVVAAAALLHDPHDVAGNLPGTAGSTVGADR